MRCDEPGWKQNLHELNEDWSIIEQVLPVGWQEQAKELKALSQPKKGFQEAGILLRVMLMHLSSGCSLRETAVRARAGGLVSVSDVALLKRLRRCGAWFQWLVAHLCRRLSGVALPSFPGKRIRLVDASMVCEPGATGSTWRLHYAVNLSNLCCDEVRVSSAAQGESLTRYAVQPGDVLMGDRGLAHRRGIAHVLAHQGDVIVRFSPAQLPLQDSQGQPVALLPLLRQLEAGQAGDWSAWRADDQGRVPVRVCAYKKSAAQAHQAQHQLRQEAKHKQRAAPRAHTLEAAGYVLILTTWQGPNAATLLELYRSRWQIELAFKRLKSLLQLGHLKKTDPDGAKAWLQGKLLIASLIETLIALGERFSPWGYEADPARSPALMLSMA
jgi:hypothetical protein